MAWQAGGGEKKAKGCEMQWQVWTSYEDNQHAKKEDILWHAKKKRDVKA